MASANMVAFIGFNTLSSGGRIYLSAVPKVNTGRIAPRVGAGFSRIHWDAEAAFRSVVLALGLGTATGSLWPPFEAGCGVAVELANLAESVSRLRRGP